MTVLIIYLVGYVVAWPLCRIFFRQAFEEEYNWGSVLLVFIYSSLSWVMAFIMFLLLSIENDSKPPKWL